MFEQIFENGFYPDKNFNKAKNILRIRNFKIKNNKNLIQRIIVPFEIREFFAIDNKVNPRLFDGKFNLKNLVNSDEKFYALLSETAWKFYPYQILYSENSKNISKIFLRKN